LNAREENDQVSIFAKRGFFGHPIITKSGWPNRSITAHTYNPYHSARISINIKIGELIDLGFSQVIS